MKVKTLFFGTAEFAVSILKALIASDEVEVVGVVTQPDKAAGRDHDLMIVPVKQLVNSIDINLARSNIRMFQPDKLREDAARILEETAPEIIIVAAYGQMIPDEIINYPKYGIYNLHGSLLPDLRGAVPVQMSILLGRPQAGITMQKLVKALDEGDIAVSEPINLNGSETTESLMTTLADVAADLTIGTIPKIVSGDIEFVPQDHSQATYCYQSDIAKDKAEIKIDTDVELAERMIRAFYPWPVAWCLVKMPNGEPKRLKIFAANIIDPENGAEMPVNAAEGLQLSKHGKTLLLPLKNGILELKEVQLEGKQRRSAKDYLFLAT